MPRIHPHHLPLVVRLELIELPLPLLRSAARRTIGGLVAISILEVWLRFFSHGIKCKL